MENNFNLLSIGDASLDVFMSPFETEVLCELDSKKCLACFSYGDKIPVKNLEFSIGGNAANNAVGTSRLGAKTGIVITLGDDTVGSQILDKLKSEGVDLTYSFRQKETASNYSTIINYNGERTIFVYHAPRSYEYPIHLPKVPWVYLTSMGENFEPFYVHMSTWLHENPDIKLAFNPGSWQLRAGVDKIKDILSLTNIIFVNKEEAQKLTSSEINDTKKLLENLTHLGPKIAVITDGANGSSVYNSITKKFLRIGTLPVPVFERTGAGDAFGSGCLSALIEGKSLEEALVWGTVNSASVIGYTGSQRGLLHKNELQLWLDRASSSNIKPEEF